MMRDYVLPVLMVLSIIIALLAKFINLLIKIHTKKIEKEIEKLQKDVELLRDIQKNLGKKIDRLEDHILRGGDK